MNFVQILGVCPQELADIISIVRFVVTAISWAVPIILIILCVLDVAKIVTAGNIDDKLKKEVTGKITTRLIFAVVIFLVPTIVRLVFRLVPVASTDINKASNVVGATWQDCWDAK